jgi:hypothetical protein
MIAKAETLYIKMDGSSSWTLMIQKDAGGIHFGLMWNGNQPSSHVHIGKPSNEYREVMEFFKDASAD